MPKEFFASIDSAIYHSLSLQRVKGSRGNSLLVRYSSLGFKKWRKYATELKHCWLCR